jgi:hypothetical protein
MHAQQVHVTGCQLLLLFVAGIAPAARCAQLQLRNCASSHASIIIIITIIIIIIIKFVCLHSAGWRPVHRAAPPLRDNALGQAGPQGGPGRGPGPQLPARTGEQIIQYCFYVLSQKQGIYALRGPHRCCPAASFALYTSH